MRLRLRGFDKNGKNRIRYKMHKSFQDYSLLEKVCV